MGADDSMGGVNYYGADELGDDFSGIPSGMGEGQMG
jgi:hypothetical protein